MNSSYIRHDGSKCVINEQVPFPKGANQFKELHKTYIYERLNLAGGSTV